mmetsp:Transcript_96413/g.241719  ORF Transcript_96413/g.241719 Transcript_96413/m.241719 type:complete len:271 (-) Transcript_96413:127-939(-)
MPRRGRGSRPVFSRSAVACVLAGVALAAHWYKLVASNSYTFTSSVKAGRVHKDAPCAVATDVVSVAEGERGLRRRLGLSALLSTIAPGAAGAVPLFMDQRPLEQVAPAASAAQVDRSSPAAQKVATAIGGYEEKAQAALDALQADPKADISGYFGLKAGGLEDDFLTALKKQELDGPFAARAAELRAVAGSVDDLVPSGSKADSERVGRIMLTAWYKVVQDKAFTVPLDKTDILYDAKVSRRTNDDGPVVLAKEIQAWLDALRVLRKFVA